jgi:hypothetical protein
MEGCFERGEELKGWTVVSRCLLGAGSLKSHIIIIMYVLWHWKFFCLYVSKLLELNLSNDYPCNQKTILATWEIPSKACETHVYCTALHFSRFCQFISRRLMSLEMSKRLRVICSVSIKLHGVTSQKAVIFTIAWYVTIYFTFAYVIYCITFTALLLQSRKMPTLNTRTYVRRFLFRWQTFRCASSASHILCCDTQTLFREGCNYPW